MHCICITFVKLWSRLQFDREWHCMPCIYSFDGEFIDSVKAYLDRGIETDVTAVKQGESNLPEFQSMMETAAAGVQRYVGKGARYRIKQTDNGITFECYCCIVHWFTWNGYTIFCGADKAKYRIGITLSDVHLFVCHALLLKLHSWQYLFPGVLVVTKTQV